MKVIGGCHCGHIIYEAEVDPATVRACHCTDCQKLTGTALRAAIPSLPATFVLKSGTPKIYIMTAESGRKRVQALCLDCGAPIYATSPSVYGLRFGTVDQRVQLAPPARQQWCRSAVPWSMDLTHVQRVEREGGWPALIGSWPLFPAWYRTSGGPWTFCGNSRHW